MLTTQLPLVNETLLELLGAPDSVDILLNPTGYAQDHSPDQIDQNESGNDVSFNFDFAEPSNIVDLLSGHTANLVSLTVNQTFTAPTDPIPIVPETPLFSFLGLVTVTGSVTVTPEFSLQTDVQMGLDTNGFYVMASNGNDAISVTGGLDFGVSVKGYLTVVPLAQVTGSGDLTLTAGIGLTSPNNDGKLYAGEVLDPNNMTANVAAAIDLGLSAEIGFIDLTPPIVATVGPYSRTIPLFNSGSTSFADITQQFDDFKNQISQEGGRLKDAGGRVHHRRAGRRSYRLLCAANCRGRPHGGEVHRPGGPGRGGRR